MCTYTICDKFAGYTHTQYPKPMALAITIVPPHNNKFRGKKTHSSLSAKGLPI